MQPIAAFRPDRSDHPPIAGHCTLNMPSLADGVRPSPHPGCRARCRIADFRATLEGSHDYDVELQEIMPILRKLDVGGFVLPFANPRHAHEYAVPKDFPLDPNQVIVAGVIDSVTNFIEHPKTIAERIERVAEAVGDPRRRLGWHRLRVRYLRGSAARRGGHRVGESLSARRRCAHRVRAAVLTARQCCGQESALLP